jgi:hypothetical protein
VLCVTPLRVRKKLRCLASIKHPIVANNTDLPVPHGLMFFCLRRRPIFGGLRISPRDKKRQLAWIVDASENVMIDDPTTVQIKAKAGRQLG